MIAMMMMLMMPVAATCAIVNAGHTSIAAVIIIHATLFYYRFSLSLSLSIPFIYFDLHEVCIFFIR